MATGFDKHQPITKTAVADLIRRDRHAVGRALAEVRPINGSRPPKYPLQEALLAALTSEQSKLDAQQERARKDKEAADKLELENALTRKELAPVEVLGETLEDLVGSIKAVLRRKRKIPTKLKEEIMDEIARVLEKKAEG